MFIDRLLENWSEVVLANEFGKVKLDTGGASWNNIYAGLKQSIIFDVTNVEEYFRSQKPKQITFKDFPNVRPVFPHSFFEWKPGYYEAKTLSIVAQGSFVTYVQRDEGSIDVYTFNFQEWQRQIRYLGCNGWKCDLNGELTGILPVTDYLKEFTKMGSEAEKVIFILRTIEIPMTSLSFLHCKNVIIQSHDISDKLQRARIRRGKLPIFTFKTLEIKPMTKILREEGGSETHGLARALHICRGHFKDYSQGPGLGRGHAKGLYWWDSMVRGSREVGAVIKDYKVSPPSQNTPR